MLSNSTIISLVPPLSRVPQPLSLARKKLSFLHQIKLVEYENIIQITYVQLFRARASDIRKQGCETFFPFLPTTYTIHYYFTYILNLIQRPKTFILLTRILSLTWWQVLCFDTKIFYGVISVIKTPLYSFFSILSPHSYDYSFFDTRRQIARSWRRGDCNNYPYSDIQLK